MKIHRQYSNQAQEMKITSKEREGQLGWKSPSNIALVKYWGKRGEQLPMNPSLSFTLRDSITSTRVKYRYSDENKGLKFRYFFAGEERSEFSARIRNYLMKLEHFLPFISFLDLEIHSENTFPHSSGIASSASAFSALALCLVELETELTGSKLNEQEFFQKASFLARLGSGSACRSVYGGLVLWGNAEGINNSSDEYAIPFDTETDALFLNFHDTILLLDTNPKMVSSSFGHRLMESNPYARTRFASARESLEKIRSALKQGETAQFIDRVEYEALSLHAMMMTSEPGFLLLKPASLEVIERVRKYRIETGTAVGFTIDAGANVHLLYSDRDKTAVETFVETELRPFCISGQLIHDRVGPGPEKIEIA